MFAVAFDPVGEDGYEAREAQRLGDRLVVGLVGKDALFLAVVVDAVIAEIFLRLLCADLHAFVDDGSQFLFLALSVKSYL